MNYQKLFDTLQNMGFTALETDMQEIVRAVETDAYNQGVRDAAENALLLYKQLNFRNQWQEKELRTWGCDPDHFEVSKQSILKLLK